MDKAELRKLLGLPDVDEVVQEPIKSGVYCEVDYPPGSEEGFTINETALELDEWDLQVGKQLKETVPQNDFKDEGEWISEAAWADFHAIAFNADPKLVELCSDPRRKEFLQVLMDSADYKRLRLTTLFNTAASEAAAIAFAKQYDVLIAQDEDTHCKGNWSEEKKQLEKDLHLFNAVCVGLSEATEQADLMDDVAHALSCGPGQPSNERLNRQKIGKLFQRCKDSELLRRICQKAGRFRMVAQSRQRQKTTHGMDEFTGVMQDADAARLLPVELGALATPELELDTMRRFMERQTLCREFRGTIPVGKGPIVICVDESGSMDGEPIENAKAFCLGMAYVAGLQNRWCCLIGYSGDTEGTRLVLKPGQWDHEKLMDWLEHFYGAGTVMDVPLIELPNVYWKEFNPPKGKTDVIIITDGLVRVPKDVETSFNAWKVREQVRTYGLLIGRHSFGSLNGVLDESYNIDEINASSEGVGKCLAI